MRPEITGETENGKSMNDVRRLLPRKSYLETAQAAATPNAEFKGTAMSAVMTVSLMEESASGSPSASHAASRPFSSAAENTVMSGSSRNKTTKAMVTPTSVQRVSG